MFVDWMMAVLRFAAVASVCPRIVPRDEWGARVPKGVLEMRNPVSTVVIHHTYSPSYCADNDNCVKAMQSMQKFHQDDRGWDDIGYSFVVGGDGRVYKGRGWNRVGAHSPPYNADSIGISLIGDWREEAPPKAMLDAVEWLIRCGVDTGRIAPDYQLIGHRQARDTECPGDALYAVIQTWQRYTANPAPPKVRVSSSRHHPQTDADTPDVKFTVVEPLGALSPTVAAVGTYDPKTPFYAERDAVEVRQLPKPWDRLWHIWYQAELKRQREAERAQHIEALKDEAAQQQEEEALRIEEAQQHAVEALKIEAAQQQDEEALKGEVAKQQDEEALRVEEAQQQDEEALKDEVVQQQDEEALKIEAAQQQVEEDVKKLLQQARGAQLALEILIAQQAERAQKEEAVVLAGQDVQRSS